MYGFLLKWRRYSDYFNNKMWEYGENIFFYHILKSVLPNNTQKVSFRTQYSKSVLPNMMPCVLPNMKLELSWNWKKSAVLTLISSPPTSSKTYPYPKGEHNGAIGPIYASISKWILMEFFNNIEKNWSQWSDRLLALDIHFYVSSSYHSTS